MPSAAEASGLACRGSRSDDRRVRFPSLTQIYNKRQLFPFYVERPQCFLADVFVFGNDDDSDFGPFLVGEVAQKTLAGSHPCRRHPGS